MAGGASLPATTYWSNMGSSLGELIKPLSKRQRKYILGIVLIGKEDARSLDVPIRTVQRWRKDPAFVKAVAEAVSAYSPIDALAGYLEDDVFPIISQIRDLALMTWEAAGALANQKKWAMGLILQLVTASKPMLPATGKGDTYNTLLQFISKGKELTTQPEVKQIVEGTLIKETDNACISQES